MNTDETMEEKYKPELWQIVRENLEWYRGVENPDHGDLVIAEEAIMSAIRAELALREQEIVGMVKKIREEAMRMEAISGSYSTKGAIAVCDDLLDSLTQKEV